LAARPSSGDLGAEKAQLHRFANKANENPFYLYQTSIYQCLFSVWKNKMTLLPEKRAENTSVIVFINNERKSCIRHSAVSN